MGKCSHKAAIYGISSGGTTLRPYKAPLCLFHLPLAPSCPRACEFSQFLCVCVCIYQDVSGQRELQPGLLPGSGSIPSQPQLSQQPVLLQRRLRELRTLEAEVHARAVRSTQRVCGAAIYRIRQVYHKQQISLSPKGSRLPSGSFFCHFIYLFFLCSLCNYCFHVLLVRATNFFFLLYSITRKTT